MREAGLSTLHVAAAAAGEPASVRTASGTELTGEAAIAALLEKAGSAGATPAQPGGGGMAPVLVHPPAPPRGAAYPAQMARMHQVNPANMIERNVAQRRMPKRRRDF